MAATRKTDQLYASEEEIAERVLGPGKLRDWRDRAEILERRGLPQPVPKRPRSQALSSVDKYIGQRIRAQRLARGSTQKQLGEKVGVTFQQIQKYESGADRVASSMLLQIAIALDTSLLAFFPVTADGGAGDDATTTDDVSKLVDRPDTVKLLRAFKGVGGAKRRAMLIEVVEAMRSRYLGGGGGR
jgi:transcriptional regulator with XRE-family HTH domain